jgi:hypothetical protein
VDEEEEEGSWHHETCRSEAMGASN